MFFNKATILKNSSYFDFMALEQAIDAGAVFGCQAHAMVASGWSEPLNADLVNPSELIRQIMPDNSVYALCFKMINRLLPESVINSFAEEAIEIAESQQGRLLAKREINSIKDELRFLKMPLAFELPKRTDVIVDIQNNLIILNTNKPSVALSINEKLAANGFNTEKKFIGVDWFSTGNFPPGLILAGCVLNQDGSKVVIKKADFTLEGLLSLIDEGAEIVNVDVVWQETLSCTMNSDMSLSKIAYFQKKPELVGNRIIDFDSSSSFTYEKLKMFIDYLTLQTG